MSMIDEQASMAASTAELSEELIFLIAAVSTDAQRKRAIDLFRRFSWQLGAEAYRRGQDDFSRSMNPPPVREETLMPDHRVGIIPPIKWQD